MRGTLDRNGDTLVQDDPIRWHPGGAEGFIHEVGEDWIEIEFASPLGLVRYEEDVSQHLERM